MQGTTVRSIEDLPLLLTVPEAAKVLRVGVSRAYEMAHRGEIPAVRIGRRVRVPRDALTLFLKGVPEERNSPIARV
ncbi:helix-turn-helix domain-containing protein [Thermaerobacter subterraneus]|uniref:DNA-binding protein, excisionase family n=1 Tax=Thermaerobacter subterraneus DSM 13965 TaxID=867903 RepID=K6Q0A7_9FIRM|nr:helix-turn-helix domain-containing protein [Thermaerobacter subterraneus]EKP94488.1 DNA-binding protein, excisionase family [Thermaerobacter subterraneus DSM 13965]